MVLPRAPGTAKKPATKKVGRNVPRKMCIACNKVKATTDFYPNRAWAAQQNCDIYCKDCAKAMVHSKNTFRQYLWENNRLFSERLWEDGEARAKKVYSNNKEYLASSTSASRKKEIEEETTATACLAIMNLVQYYRYNDNTDETGNLDPFDPDSLNGTLIKTTEGDKVEDTRKIYDPMWNGTYTKRELAYLDGYYEQLENSFSLDDISMQDYARKIAKASLEADETFEDYRAGKATQKQWLDAQNAFDSMSKSATFAASQRKNVDAGSQWSISEIVAKIELEHSAEMPVVTYPPDDIDRILGDFRHTDDAIK